jgi:putative membrane protein
MKSTPLYAIAAAAALFAAGPSYGQPSSQQSPKTSQSAKASGADAKYLKQLAQDNLAEIELGKLAQQKARDPQVKDFAQKMVDDHSKLLDNVQKVAEEQNVQLPTTPDAKHQKLMNKLQSLSGEKFDRQYMQAMVKDHKQAIKLLSRTEKRAKAEPVKSAAQQAEPQIREHLQMAQSVSKSEKASAAGKTAKSGSQAGAAR